MNVRRFYVNIFFATLSLYCNAQPCFNVSTLLSDSNTTSICTADFNGDGNSDIAVGNFGSSTVSIFLNTGGGNFSGPVHFISSGNDPRGITSADFNGDGIADLAVANFYTYDIAVLFGTGTGTFGAATSYPTGGYGCRAITSADFNADGKMDIVATGDNANVAVFLNPGGGNFGTAMHYLLGVNTAPHDIIATDLNNDGIIDITTANSWANDVAVLFGTGSGTFGTASYYSAGLNANGICSADLNGDGIKDMVTANPGTHDVSVLLGTGTGTFGSATNYTVGAANANYVVATDFDQDCNVDIAVTTETPHGVVLLKGNGTGVFGAPILFSMVASPWQMCMADFDKDGRMDLANTTGYGIGLLMNCSFGPCSSSIDEIRKNNFSVYPVPATDKINLQLDVNSEKAVVLIQNSLGQTVKKLAYTNTIDVSDLPEGYYILQITLVSGETYKAKFIKQ